MSYVLKVLAHVTKGKDGKPKALVCDFPLYVRGESDSVGLLFTPNKDVAKEFESRLLAASFSKRFPVYTMEVVDAV